MVSSMMSSRLGEGFRRPSDREDIVYRDRGQLGLLVFCSNGVASVVPESLLITTLPVSSRSSEPVHPDNEKFSVWKKAQPLTLSPLDASNGWEILAAFDSWYPDV